MSSHFSESRDSSYVSLAMYPEFSRKDWRIESVKLQYTHWKAAKRSSKDQVEWLQLQPCLVPSWCGASRTIWDCCWSRGIWGPPRTAAQRLSPKGERARKWVNEWVCSLHSTFLFSLFAKSECRIQIIKHIWTETCVIVKMSWKYQTQEGKWCWHPKAPPRHPFKNLKKTLLYNTTSWLE